MFFSFSFWMPVIILVILDYLVYRGIRIFLNSRGIDWKYWMGVLHWLISGLFVVVLTTMIANREMVRSPFLLSLFYKIVGFFVLVYFPKIVFLIFLSIDKLRQYAFLGLTYVFYRLDPLYRFKQNAISPVGISTRIGIILAFIVAILISYGLTLGRHYFQVEQVELKLEGLPASMDGLRMAQISDVHLGSLYGQEHQVSRAIEMIMAEKPDLIVFTGDMVNNFSREMDAFIPIFARLHAPFGKFAILGNHDYGDYSSWGSLAEKEEDHSLTLAGIRNMGFEVLLNQWVALKNGDDSLFLVGVENWGKPPFPKYGELGQAMEGIPENAFCLLMSHDPSHWEGEVWNEPRIKLTLSGHTHGFQLGVRVGTWQWSPVSWFYSRWAGLYQEGEQYLYVNRGLGYLGFPGRIGMRPEITILTLRAG